MSNRVWLHQTLLGDATLVGMVPGGFASTTHQEVTPALKPFLIHRVLAHRPATRGDDDDITRAESFLLFVHDVPGDYMKIDDILARMKVLLQNYKNAEQGIARVTWIEDSEDFRDEDMGTILRYSRYQVRYQPGVADFGS